MSITKDQFISDVLRLLEDNEGTVTDAGTSIVFAFDGFFVSPTDILAAQMTLGLPEIKKQQFLNAVAQTFRDYDVDIIKLANGACDEYEFSDVSGDSDDFTTDVSELATLINATPTPAPSPPAPTPAPTPTPAPPNPSGRRLLKFDDLEFAYSGYFSVGSHHDGGSGAFSHSNGIHCQYGPDELLISGHPHYRRQNTVRLPSVLDGSETMLTGQWKDYGCGMKPDGSSKQFNIAGMIRLPGGVLFSTSDGYNASPTNWQCFGSHVIANEKCDGLLPVVGDNTHSKVCAGYMGYAPSSLVSRGWTFITGQNGTSGSAIGRSGPNLFAARNNGESIEAAPMMLYSGSHAHPDWWISDRATGMAWIETDDLHGVIFTVIVGTGTKWYGGGTDANGVKDPYSNYQGYHSEGRNLELWIYDPDELVDVLDGKREPWGIEPKSKTTLIELLPGDPAGNEIYYEMFQRGAPNRAVSCSFQDGRLVVLHSNSYLPGKYTPLPTGYVFDF